MTRLDHYLKAEELLDAAAQEGGSLWAQHAVASAQVHATLANYTGPVTTGMKTPTAVEILDGHA
jgi:hypothetical protein